MPTPNARPCLKIVRIGFFAGGMAVGGTKPKTSSMYASTRRSDVPGCPRIHVTSFESRSVTTNWRSGSERWARYTIAHRGLPSGVRRSVAGSSDWPAPQAANDGEATSAFSFIASSVRSAGAKKASISNTPSLRIGGVTTWPMRAPRSRSWPARQAFSIRFESRTCSRLESGSAAIPTSPSRLVTVPSISSRRVSASVSHGSSGAFSEPTTLSGIPASEPGVYTASSAASRSARTRSEPMPLASSPSRQIVAVRCA